MDVFLTIAGLAAGISLFLYLVNLYDSGKRAIEKKTDRQKGEVIIPADQRVEVKGDQPRASSAVRDLPDDLKDQLPLRKCPLCFSILSRDEPLYATHMDIGKERKILIYGCPYCYKDEKKKETDQKLNEIR